MDKHQTIVDRIRSLAKKRGLNITTLEETLGMGNGTIGRWTKCSPNTDKIAKVADYFNVSIDYLVGRDTSEKSTKPADYSVTEDDLKFALWGDCQDIDEADLEDVRHYAAFVRERKRKK